MFDEIVKIFIGTPPETFETVYVFLVYVIEVFTRMALFGFVLRFVSNIFSLVGGNSSRFFS